MPHPLNSTQPSDDDSSSDVERPYKKQRPESSSSPSRSEGDGDAIESSSLQDITAAALAEDGDIYPGRPPRSAFSFSPAKPPAAYVSSRPGLEHLCNAPASTASSRRWTNDALQRHVDSFAFYGRDRIEGPSEMPDTYADVEEVGHAMRVDTFEKTGALIWFQAQCLEDDVREADGSSFSVGCTFGHTYLDGSGRQRGQERLLNSYGPYDSAELPALSDDTSLAGPQHILQHSHLGLSPYRHEPDTNNPFYDVVLYDFLKLDDADEARGMYRSQWVEPEEDDYANHQSGGWFVYDKLCFETTLSTTVQPLKPDDACSGILMGFDQVFGEDGRGDELNLTVTISEHDDGGYCLWALNLSPLSLSFPRLPQPEKHSFSHIAINEDTGYCWLGHVDGSIEYFDALKWIDDNMMTCPRFEEDSFEDQDGHEGYCPCSVKTINPRQVESPKKSRGAVTNLIAVGRHEVVAAFSNGAIMLLQRAVKKGGKNIIVRSRKFVGHVNEGRRIVEMAVHTPSRLMAVRGTDGQLRIWHLDNSYPLNTAWHRPRTAQQLPLNLLPEAPSPQKGLLKRTAGGEFTWSNVARGPQDLDDDDIWDRLAAEDAHKPTFAHIKDARLTEIRARHFCGMAWTPTSWLADRDGQWEMSRGFDEAGRPKVVSSGLLPSLVCCSDRPKGATFLYFEQERRVGVDDAEVVDAKTGRSGLPPIEYEGIEDLD